jgi:hypothetical protein
VNFAGKRSQLAGGGELGTGPGPGWGSCVGDGVGLVLGGQKGGGSRHGGVGSWNGGGAVVVVVVGGGTVVLGGTVVVGVGVNVAVAGGCCTRLRGTQV